MSRIIQKISTLFNRVSRRNGSQTNAGHVEEKEEKYNPLKVIEKIQDNQQQIQEEMEKIQNKINYCEEAEKSAADQNKMAEHEQIKIDQEQIRKEMEKMQIQINNYGEIYKLVHNEDGFKLKGLRKNIRLVVCNCKDLFKTQEFSINSESIEVLKFKWWLRACTEKTKTGFLKLFLCLKRPESFCGDYRIEIDFRLSILNAFHGKDLVKEYIGLEYKNTDQGTGRGFEMAKLEDLLNPEKDFLRPDESIEVEADFTIKSSTLDHLL